MYVLCLNSYICTSLMAWCVWLVYRDLDLNPKIAPYLFRLSWVFLVKSNIIQFVEFGDN